jgi:hypothetical protein
MSDDITAEINAVREAFIASIPEEAPEAELEAAPADTVEPSEPAPAPAPEPPKEPEARAYRKLLDGEAKLRAEREAFKAERLQAEAELAEYRKVKDRVKASPIAFLQGVGLTDAEILEAIQEAHGRDLGKLAPPEVQAKLAVKEAQRVAREAEERLTAREQAAAKAAEEAKAQAYVAEYQRGIEQFVTSGLTDYPQLAAVAAAGKPVAQAIYQTACEMAAANPNGPSPTYADVAKQLNNQLAELASVVAAPTVTATAHTAPIAPGKPVLRNSSTQAQPSPAPEKIPASYNEYKEDLRQKVLAKHGIAPR